MANERTHMNTQGGTRLRQATAVNGNTAIGSQPIHGGPSVTSTDPLALAFPGGKEVSFLRTCALRRRSEVHRHLCGRSCEPVQCGKSDRGSGAGCIRR